VTNWETEGFEGRMGPSSVRRGGPFVLRAAPRRLLGVEGEWHMACGIFSAFHPSEGTSPAGGRPPLPPPPDRSHLLSGLRVLVVEDDADARELVTAILEDAGAVVEAAESAAAGFAAMTSFRPNLLVSDISMPDEDGYSLIRRVRALAVTDGGDIPSIALTAHTRIEDRAKALRAGFTLHLGKPVRPVDLVSAVKTLATSASN
jgi:CheY-like chemotaxis protein